MRAMGFRGFAACSGFAAFGFGVGFARLALGELFADDFVRTLRFEGFTKVLVEDLLRVG